MKPCARRLARGAGCGVGCGVGCGAAAAALVALAALAGGARAGERHRVPEGFTIEEAAIPPAVRFPMFAAFDERGRLFVAESSGGDLYAELSALTRACRVRLLEDLDGDGRYETSRVFAAGLVFPMGLAWRAGKLYVADPPDLVALADTDGDGAADRREVVLTGFGHRDNGSLHGVTFGPDGLLYMTLGSPDGYRLRRDDGSFLVGETGALFRARPDGSGIEVVARGFENLVEVVFLPSGEIVGTDNWFQLPQAGVRDALVHLVEGGFFPMRGRRGEQEKGSPQPLTGVGLGAVGLYPAVALSGLVRCRSTSFPVAWRDSLFSAQHNARRVGRHVLEREGATFRTRDFDFVTSDDPDFHPSDVLEAADGSLLVVDTGGWYVHHCPTGRIRDSRAPGGIFRVRWAGAEPVRDARGAGISWGAAGAPELAALLADPRAAVRDRAQAELAARGEAAVPALAAIAAAAGAAPGREHAVWALAAIPGAAAGRTLRALLDAPEADLAALACRAVAHRGDREAGPGLRRLLAHNRADVRLAAAEALGRAGGPEAAGSLIDALVAAADPFLEHAVVVALHRVAPDPDLERALTHPHPRVVKAALLLLDQAPRARLSTAAVVERLAATDAALRQAAVAILARRRDGAVAAVALVRDAAGGTGASGDAALLLRELVPAFARDAGMQEAVVVALAGRAGSEEARLAVLQALAAGGLEELPRSWEAAVGEILRGGRGATRAQAVRVAAVFQARALDADLARVAADESEPRPVRLEALRAAAPRLSGLSPELAAVVAAALAPGEEPLLRLAALETAVRVPLPPAALASLLGAAAADPLLPPALVLRAIERAAAAAPDPGVGVGEEAAALLSYLEGAVRGGFRPRPEALQAVVARLPEAFAARSAALLDLLSRSRDDERGKLRGLEPLLAAGSAERGRAVFFGGKAGCSACHRVGEAGGDVGPDLTRLAAVRSSRDLLESVVFPSSTFAQGFETYAATTTDGDVAAGVIARRTADVVVLRAASGAEVQLRVDRLASLERQETSLMPEGLDRAITPEELRDLLAFLASLR